MRVKVLYYGFLKSLTGASEADLELGAPDASVRALVATVAARIGLPPERLDSAVAAVDGELVARSHALHEGDVVSLLPPVSGG